MKTKDLEGLGLSKEQIDYVMKENGKSIKDLQDQVSKLTAERDTYAEKLKTAEDTLKKFDGIEPEKITEELKSWKDKAEKAEKEYSQKLYERDFSSALDKALEEVKFTSSYAKKAVIEQIKSQGLTMRNGEIIGLNDLIDSIKKEDASAFVDEKQEALETKRIKVTAPSTNNSGKGNGGAITKADIMKIKDSAERQRMIAQNIELFRNGE